MQLTHSFTVPVGVDEAWAVLRDIERIGPCMPGATIESVDGDDFTGSVKVRVGPISMAYRGSASFVDVDEVVHRAAIDASGKETRGSGTARAHVAAELHEVEDGTKVTVVTDLTVTGRPAQFGRGVMADVGGKLIQQFADCLSEQLASQPEQDPPGAEPDAATTSAAATGLRERPPPTSTPSPPRATPDTIDLLDVAGTPVLKRLAPVAGAVGVLLLMLRGLRGKRARRARRRTRRTRRVRR